MLTNKTKQEKIEFYAEKILDGMTVLMLILVMSMVVFWGMKGCF